MSGFNYNFNDIQKQIAFANLADEQIKDLISILQTKRNDKLEMSRYVQSKNPLNLKYTQYRICFSEWSVAKRRKTDSRAAVRLRFFGSRLTSLCN